MSQVIKLRAATATLIEVANTLGVSTTQLHLIEVVAEISITSAPTPRLNLTYNLKLPRPFAAQLEWSQWQPKYVGFSDYLWEHTCLECFLGTAQYGASTVNANHADASRVKTDTAYIEINASPSGRYAVYRFDSYRSPATLPPPRLLLTDNRHASIHWDNTVVDALDAQCTSLVYLYPLSKYAPASLISRYLHLDWYVSFNKYVRRFSVPLQQLSDEQFTIGDVRVQQIHPCVILRLADSTLYFAPEHPGVPDFHARRTWSNIDYNAVLKP